MSIFRQATRAILLEDFGNLKVLPRTFLNRVTDTWRNSGVKFGLGRDSEVKVLEDAPDLMPSVEKLLSQELGAIMLSIGHVNLGLLTPKMEKSGRFSSRESWSDTYCVIYAVRGDWQFDFKAAAQEAIKSMDHYGEAKLSRQSCKKLFKVLIDLSRRAAEPIIITELYVDRTRKQKQIDRAKSRSGMIERVRAASLKYGFDRQGGQKAEIDRVKAELRSKLELMKQKKSPAFTSLEEMLEAIKTNGYFEKVKINGIQYKRNGWTGSVDDLINGKQSGFSEFAIRYAIEMSGDTSAMDAIRSKRAEATVALRAEIAKELGVEPRAVDSEHMEAIYQEVDRLFPRPPSNIKILFKLEGGMIVPDRIEEEKY